jgi:predicted dinucleotide-binding enzyme
VWLALDVPQDLSGNFRATGKSSRGNSQPKRENMKIAVLGTGMVGNAIATKLVNVGHQIMMGSRTANSDAGQEWLRGVGGKAQVGTFADAATFGEIIFDCTNGANALTALRSAGANNLRGKILIQVGNPLDFSKGMPPSLTVCNTDSLGEQTQREFPDVRVVKALNTMNCEIMIAPSRVPGDHDLFICGNDAAAKREGAALLSEWFGWSPANIIDLGDITNSRGTEMFLPLWVRLWGVLGTPHFNIRVIREK